MWKTVHFVLGVKMAPYCTSKTVNVFRKFYNVYVYFKENNLHCGLKRSIRPFVCTQAWGQLLGSVIFYITVTYKL